VPHPPLLPSWEKVARPKAETDEGPQPPAWPYSEKPPSAMKTLPVVKLDSSLAR
jgi:hypothetical protein